METVTKTVGWGKFRGLRTNIRRQDRSQIKALCFYLQEPEKEEQTELKFSRSEGTLKMRAEISTVEHRRAAEEINEAKS